ncbi:restriction endonuclease subunit S [Bacillus sp. CRN 9]|nr:restriction endonuclease subunit S [Bacillus sp. CRN 9]
MKTLESVLDVRDGTHDSPSYLESGVPFITSKNLKNGKLDFSNVSYISGEDHEKFKHRSQVSKGDILFGMIGTVGNPVIVDVDFEFSIKNVALIKFHGSAINNKFILEFLNSSITVKQFKKMSNGGVQKFISLGMIRKSKVLVPPLHEQERIATIFSTIDEQIETYEQEKEKYIELKKGLMQQLLTGKVRVKV